jgi:methyltransferase-like protein/cyclopropane fatty-acyl-phospholipid synthase-like methyltransferase
MSITRTRSDRNASAEKETTTAKPTSANNPSTEEKEAMSSATETRDDPSATEIKNSPNGTATSEGANGAPASTDSAAQAAVEGTPTSIEPGEGKGITSITSTPKVQTEETYDEVPYPGGTYRNTHPCHLAMVARMCGITPTPPGHCRVLELGSSMGGNLIPMAQDLPNSHFIGVDLSARQIKDGQDIIEKLGLKNIELRHMSISDIDESYGKFDYIICHGVYSWVPPEVQRAILDIGRKHLSSNGILYVSYNTYPGWHLRGVVREMMRYHVAGFESPKQKIAQARGLLDFLVKFAKSRSQAYAHLLKEEAQMLEGRLDSYIYHEHLEVYNEPIYFHEFVKRAAESGLRYLADAAISSMVAQLFDESAAEILKDVPLLRREQYMDFLRSRMFRCSLVCLPENVPNYRMPSHNLRDLHVALNFRMEGTPTETDGEVVWKHPTGKVTTQKPITAVMERLNNSWPAWTPVQDLLDTVPESFDKTPVLDAIMMGFIRGLLQLAEDPIPVCTQITEKPRCTPLAQLQASRGNKISNLQHFDYIFQPQQRLMIEHMDGTRTAEDLGEVLREAVASGRLKVSQEGSDIAPADLKALDIVQAELQRLSVMAMLAG